MSPFHRGFYTTLLYVTGTEGGFNTLLYIYSWGLIWPPVCYEDQGLVVKDILPKLTYVFFSIIPSGVPVIPVVIPVAIDRDFAVAYSHEEPREIQL